MADGPYGCPRSEPYQILGLETLLFSRLVRPVDATDYSITLPCKLSCGGRRQALAICRYGSPFAITAQAIRAILLASATASRAQRARRLSIHGFNFAAFE